MEQAATHLLPNRVTDLIVMKNSGSSVSCRVSFEILPVEFAHRNNPFQAFIFLSRYAGDVDGREYSFRKCYARGCPHNLCPHVSQAVMIANRYLQRDFRRLEEGGIDIERRLFTLPEMLVKYDQAHAEYGSVMTIHDYITLAQEGNEVSIVVNLEHVPAVEHFAHTTNAQVFLMVEFVITSLDKTSRIERCLACYPETRAREEKMEKVDIANERLKLLYAEFDRGAVKYEKNFF
ncbi:MAG: hypothetical protein WAM73_18700 [Desulfobacterales bacterium]